MYQIDVTGPMFCIYLFFTRDDFLNIKGIGKERINNILKINYNGDIL